MSSRGHLKDFSQEVLLVRQVFTNKDGSTATLYLACSDLTCDYKAIAEVPFTNNLAQQSVRMPKVKQKISGCFRTPEGADTFCIIRSYLASIHKQGANLFNALCETFPGQTPQPALA